MNPLCSITCITLQLFIGKQLINRKCVSTRYLLLGCYVDTRDSFLNTYILLRDEKDTIIMEILTVDPADSSLIVQQQQNQVHRQTSQVRTLKVLGAVQIGLGCVMATCIFEPSLFDILVFDCSVWKISFMVCSILGAAVFSPILLFISIPEMRFRSMPKISGFHILISAVFLNVFDPNNSSEINEVCDFGGCGYINKEYFYTISILMGVLSVVVLVITIISASYCCCCSPWDIQDQQEMVSYVNASQPEKTLNTSDIPIAVTNEQLVTTTTGETNYKTVLYP
ncbi:unnamed protein product [Mytilus coruscus]|uniref:Uncharacterized protein n=1 Tax=Mytilus coruscus TaxID=42192 RepID=A0A6J8F4C3_MYTCO|nr:unnamed protein product [Mytilus coruscus]